MFLSSTIWSDEAILRPNEGKLAYLAGLLDGVGTLSYDVSSSARSMLLYYEHAVESNISEEAQVITARPPVYSTTSKQASSSKTHAQKRIASCRIDRRRFPIMAVTMGSTESIRLGMQEIQSYSTTILPSRLPLETHDTAREPELQSTLGILPRREEPRDQSEQ